MKTMTDDYYDKMSDEDLQLQIKVAEFLGWTNVSLASKSSNTNAVKRAKRLGVPDIVIGVPKGSTDLKTVPNYLNDLNACHEFEKIMDTKQAVNYGLKLAEIIFEDDPMFSVEFDGVSIEGLFDIAHATAKQKCKAYVLTMTPNNL